MSRVDNATPGEGWEPGWALVAEFTTSPTSAFSGDFRRLCARLIEALLDDDWQFIGLDKFGMPEPAASENQS